MKNAKVKNNNTEITTEVTTETVTVVETPVKKTRKTSKKVETPVEVVVEPVSTPDTTPVLNTEVPVKKTRKTSKKTVISEVPDEIVSITVKEETIVKTELVPVEEVQETLTKVEEIQEEVETFTPTGKKGSSTRRMTKHEIKTFEAHGYGTSGKTHKAYKTSITFGYKEEICMVDGGYEVIVTPVDKACMTKRYKDLNLMLASLDKGFDFTGAVMARGKSDKITSKNVVGGETPVKTETVKKPVDFNDLTTVEGYCMTCKCSHPITDGKLVKKGSTFMVLGKCATTGKGLFKTVKEADVIKSGVKFETVDGNVKVEKTPVGIESKNRPVTSEDLAGSEGYCMKCKSKQVMNGPHIHEKGGRKMILGTCPVHGGNIFKVISSK